ncbi:MAG TPA: hypothetical protein PKK26_08430, partial [Candidatus Wallbacteria bacterium]|nr:hypothetical protein [Candidatus Wallbacteria bacterium]
EELPFGSTIDSVKIRGYSKVSTGFEFWVDRIGMLGIVSHGGENKKHSVYAWGLEDYTFYSMRVKSWDKVLNESEYAYSKYVRSKDRTAPAIQSTMAARVNYQGMKVKEPMGGVYYIKDNAGTTSEVPLYFTDTGTKTGNYVQNKEVDLSITTEDYLSFETLDSTRSPNNKISIGFKKFKDETSAEILVSQSTAYDPLPSAQYINSEWLTDIKGLGQVEEKDILLNDTSNIWLVDPLKRYSKVRYYYMNNSNYIARQIVYDDESNFVIGGDTYIDVTPGQLSKLAFYYPDTTVVEIRSSEPAFIDSNLKDTINPDSNAWVGVSAFDAQGNSILKGNKIKLKWHGYFKGVRGNMHDMNQRTVAGIAETTIRMQICPGGTLDPLRPLRTYYEPPPRPYFQIERSSNSVELAKKLLMPDQRTAPSVTYCTQEVEIYSFTGYNIKGEAYEVGVGSGIVRNNLAVSSSDSKGNLKSGDLEAYLVTTTHAGDVFWVTATNEEENIMAQSTKMRVVPSALAEMQVDPPEAEIDAESGQATFVVKGFDSFRNKARYTPKYHTPDSFFVDYFNEDEKATYEYLATNEIIISPLWTTDSHEVAYKNGKYEIENGETVGVFLSEGRTSSNTYGAGWEQGTKSIFIVDTTDANITDAFGNQINAAVSYTGSKFLSSGAELRYGLQDPPNGKGWDIDKTDVFITSYAKVFVKPLMKGYLGFRAGTSEVDMKGGGITVADMNAVLDNSDLSDALKLSVQVFDDHNQATAYDSMTEVVVKIDTAEDEFARIYKWPVTDLARGVTELKVRLDCGSVEIGITAHNSRLKPKVKLYSLNPNYKDIATPIAFSELKINVFSNKLDHLYFDPVITNKEERFSIVKGKAHPLRAYGYDYRGNPIEPLEYQPAGWTKTAGVLESQSRTDSHLDVIFNARDLSPSAGANLPVDVTVNAQARFKKLAAAKGTTTREVGIDYKRSEMGYLQIVNFGLMPFPCVYQMLDKEKLDKDGEYELSFVYMTGDSPGDGRQALPYIGVAFCKNDNNVTASDIYLLYGKPLCTNGEWSKTPMKLRFRMDGAAKSEAGDAGVNDLDAAKKVILFLGAPESNAARPAIRFDHVTVERVN